MKNQAIDSRLSLAILGLLSMRPMSGYDLRKVFLTTAMKTFSASPGAIYPALRRLEKDGLISGKVDRKNALRPRMGFTISRRGRAALIASLAQPVTREDVVWRMDSLFLRFSFMSDLVGEEKIAEFLHAFASETGAYFKELEGEFRESAPGLSFSGRAALKLGVTLFRTKAQWARRTLDEFEKRNSIKGDRR
jgi:DNA-binding PadR family transcriptional regulator